VLRTALVLSVDGEIERGGREGTVDASDARLDASGNNDENFNTKLELNVPRKGMWKGTKGK